MSIPVTVDTFVRAESNRVLAGFVPDAFGKLRHNRELVATDNHIVQRGNRDTLYSVAVFDLDAGPVTITLPDAGERLMSLTAFSQDHYTSGSVYGPGPHAVRREDVGTRYVQVTVRTMVDPNDPQDLARVHTLQDAIAVEQASPGRFEIPDWDPDSRKRIADALTVLGSTLADWTGAAGVAGEVDPVRHLIVSATGWGLNVPRDAIYISVTPERNDGETRYHLEVRDVPVDAFWSISLYNAEGYFEPNPQDAYSLNSVTAHKEADGSVVIRFGGCGEGVRNCLPIVPGWNYTVRLYRPRAEALDGSWKFPKAVPLG